MIKILLIALAGAFGAVARYSVTNWAYKIFGMGFPYGTLAVNIIGCFLLGLAMKLAITISMPDNLRFAITVGFLGALTTFSTFSYDSFIMFEAGKWQLALINISANILTGLIATFAGIYLPSLFK